MKKRRPCAPVAAKPRAVPKMHVKHAIDAVVDHLSALDTDNRRAVIERILSPFDQAPAPKHDDLETARRSYFTAAKPLTREERIKEVDQLVRALDLNIRDWVSYFTIGKAGKAKTPAKRDVAAKKPAKLNWKAVETTSGRERWINYEAQVKGGTYEVRKGSQKGSRYWASFDEKAKKTAVGVFCDPRAIKSDGTVEGSMRACEKDAAGAR